MISEVLGQKPFLVEKQSKVETDLHLVAVNYDIGTNQVNQRHDAVGEEKVDKPAELTP
jgi:hypothetical protein